MAGMFDAYPEVSADAVGPLPAAPKAPKGMFDAYPEVPASVSQPRAASGVLESIQAGFQGSAPGLAWRGKLPDLVMDPQHASWWERALSGAAHVGSELPLMIGGAIAGAPAGAALGTAVAPGVGTAVGSLLGAGAGMGAVPAAIRQTLIEAYKSGDVMTAADFWNSVREVAKTTATEAGINAAAMGAGAVAGRVVGKAIAPAIGQSISVPTAIRTIEAADLATQIAAMPTIPAILQGRLPDAQEFVDAAILIGGLKAAHVASSNIVSVFVKTGKTPAEQVADVQEGRVEPQEFVGPPEKPVDPEVLKGLLKARLDAINMKLEGTPDKTVTGPDGKPITIPGQPKQFVSPEERAERDWLAANIDNADALAKRYSLKRPQQTEDEYVPPSRAEMLKVQENLFTETARLDEMAAKAEAAPLSDPERLEMNALKARVLDLENQLRAGAPELSRTPTYTADQFVEARKQADTRLAELTTKAETEALTDTERAERVFLSNSLDRPTALAKHFGFEPILTERPTPQAIDASAQRIHDDVLRQLKDADEARKTAGLEPLGDDHAQAVAALVRARVRTRAERLGVLPESLYAERPVKIEDVNKLQGEPETPPAAEPGTMAPETPAVAGPELDLFGEPVQAAPAPRVEVQNLATQEIPLANLILSKEVPQFKMQANKEGVVQPLGGLFDRTGVGPIQVWERLDGTLEVISGRHRLDLARRSGEQTIPAQIHREAEGFDARQAATLDAQLNIREEQGSVADYAQYFKDAGIDKATAEQRGLLARAKGRTGFAIARDASPDLLASHRAGRLSDEAALVISSTAPGSERLQALGIAAVQDGKTLLYASNLMRSVDMMAAERMMAGEQGDIFGFDDSALKEASAMAKKASSKQRAISEQIAAVSGASKRPELARKMGVNVEDPAAVQAKIVELKNEQYLWDNWPLYPELVAKLRGETLKQAAVARAQPDAWADAPRDEGSYVKRSAIFSLEAEPYIKDGRVVASSRTVPNSNEFPPVGTWSIADSPGLYGRDIEQLVRIPIEKLQLGELDSQGRLDPAKRGDDERYAQWLKEGRRAPPIYVLQTEEGRLTVTDGHRRALAAKAAGAAEIEAWVNYSVPLPDGGTYSSIPGGKKIKTGMTFEMLMGDVDNPFVNERMLFQDEFPILPETPAEAAARDQVAADAAQRAVDQTSTPEFLRWFTGSQALREDGEPLPLYHGTASDIVSFDRSKLKTGNWAQQEGFWFSTSPKDADRFARMKVEEIPPEQRPHGPNVMPVFIRAMNPATVDVDALKGPIGKEFERAIQQAKAAGHDSVRFINQKGLDGEGEHWLVFEPNQIKSAIGNRGTFDPNNPNILFQDIRDRWYRSALGEAIQNANMKAAPAKGWQDFLKGQVAKGGVKADEIKWSGVEDWLKLQEGKVTKEQVADYLASNGVKVEEVMLGEVPVNKEANTIRIEEIENRLAQLESQYDRALDHQAEQQIIRERIQLMEEYASIRNDEQTYGDGINPPKFGRPDLVLPGGENYRELLLTLPKREGVVDNKAIAALTTEWNAWREARNIPPVTADAIPRATWDRLTEDEQRYTYDFRERLDSANEAAKREAGVFQSSHFDQPNILAHIRFNERTDAEGKKVLFVEEIQSDWAQKGKKEGFADPNAAQRMQELVKQYDDLNNERSQLIDEMAAMTGDGGEPFERGVKRQIEIDQQMTALQAEMDPLRTRIRNPIPAAPFVGKTDAWVSLALKRVIRYAAENGFDKVAWTRGEQQVERYSSALRKAVDTINWEKTKDGIQIQGLKDGRMAVNTTENETALSDAIGKAMADRIINDPNQTGTIEGDQITVSDTGMAGFYDKIVPKVAKEVLKKLGGGMVGEVQLGKTEGKPFDRQAVEDAAMEYMDGNIDANEFRDASGLEGISDSLIDDRLGGPTGGLRAAQRRQIVRAFANEMRDQSKGQKKTAQPGFEITPAMREGAMAGQPLFQKQTDQLHRGSYDIAENLVTTLQGADKSTVVHELAHSWLEEMKADAERPGAPEQIKQDWEMLRREFAIGKEGPIGSVPHEQFAGTFERYMGEGKAPSVELRAVFERFKEWIVQIYRSLLNIPKARERIDPELRGILDRMLATDEEIAAARDLGVPRAYVPEAAAAAVEAMVPTTKPKDARRQINPGLIAEKAAIEGHADELPPGAGEAPNNIHVNYEYMDSPLKVKLALQKIAEVDQENIQKHRGGKEGVESWQQEQATMEAALLDTLGGGPDKLGVLRGGETDTVKINHRLRAMNQLMKGAVAFSEAKRDAILAAGHDATILQQLEYLGSIERVRMLQAEFLGERAAVARAMNSLKDSSEGSGEIGRMLEAIGIGNDGTMFQSNRTPAEEQAYLKAKLDEIMQRYVGKKKDANGKTVYVGSVLDIAKLHKEIGTLKGTFKLAKTVDEATTWDKLIEGWRAGLLSGPVTHTTNLLGTEAFHVMRPAVDALATIIGMARGASPGMGESDRASMSEAVARLTGMLGGVQDGIKVAIAEFKADEATGKTEAYRTAIPGQIGRIIRTPLRLMGAEDALVTTMYTRGEIRTLAIRQAFDEDLNPSTREFAERVAYLQDNPTPEMQVAAETAATRMTFNAPLGEKGVFLQGFVNKWNLQWMIPFIRTPINIAKELLRMSPFAPAIGEWRQAFAKGGVERDRALAEMALGSGIMAITMAYAFSNDDKGRQRLTGSGGPDPGKNRGKAGVWQPYSILIGDTYYEYARIQPTGTLMGMAADMAAVWDHMTDEEKDKVPKMLSAAFAQAITNQTFLQGITNFVNALSDPARFGPRFLQQMAGSAVPNIIGQPTTMADPVVREVNSALEAIQARIPGMRQDLLPKRDWLGEPVQTKERLGVVLPVREQQISDDKVRQEAARLDISMAAAPKKTHIGKGTGKLGDVELTPQERDAFEKIGGEFAHGILQNIVNAPGYDQMPDMVKRKIFSNVLTAAHRVAAVQAMPMEKRIAYLQEITERVQQELTPGDAP